MLEWKKYLSEVTMRFAEIGKMQPDTVRGYRLLAESKPATTHLDPKTRELVALAVSVTNRCDGCIVVHTNNAKKLGATKEEIVEVLSVAASINAGTALIFSGRALDAYDNI